MIRTILFLGAISLGGYAYVGNTGTPKINFADATEHAQSCEALAAHPSDPERPHNVTGVTDDALDGEKAYAACRSAYETDPGAVSYTHLTLPTTPYV